MSTKSVRPEGCPQDRHCVPAQRIVQITDWLPPQFSAVSQYALSIAVDEAAAGNHVTVVGLGSVAGVTEDPSGVRIVTLARTSCRKSSWARRLAWTLLTNAVIVARAWTLLRQSDVIRFTGSPPFLIFFLYPANFLLRKKLVYRITDFYPECIIASLGRRSAALEALRRVTNVLRRRIDAFEVLGDDMADRLAASGVPRSRMSLRRDVSPVEVLPSTRPIARPHELVGKQVLLYSGNWGAAHDVDTFFDAYRRHHEAGSGKFVLWLNATGTGADEIDARLREARLPFCRQRLVPLDRLANLLVAPDAHLIALRDAFVGYVLPSKVFGCIDSRRPVLFIGSTGSDVHRLCAADTALPYRRVDVGDVEGVARALDDFPWTKTDVFGAADGLAPRRTAAEVSRDLAGARPRDGVSFGP